MQYFVTGASGFIGKRLVATLLKRPDSTVHFLILPSELDRVPALQAYWGDDGSRTHAIVGDLGPSEPAVDGVAIERADGSLLLDGSMASDELRARLELPELPGAGTYHTVAGLMLALLKRVPKEGDRIVWAGWRFEVVDMDGRRVDKVLVARVAREPAAEG